MKKFAVIVTVIFSLLCLSAVNTMAASVSAQFNAADGTVTVSGSGEGIVTIRVVSEGTDDSEISSDNLPVVFHQIEAEESYVYAFYMPDNAGDGKYKIFVADVNGSNESSFIYYNFAQANSLIETLDGMSEKEFVDTVTEDENAKKLGIDKEDVDYSDNSVLLMRRLYKDFSDSADFLTKYNFCNAVNSLYGKENEEVEERLSKYSRILGIDFNADFNENEILDEDVKEKVLSFLSSADYIKQIEKAQIITADKDFKAFFKAACILGGANSIENWTGLKEIYTEDYPFLEETVIEKNPDIDEVSLDDVFVQLSKLKFTDISDIKENFDIALEKAKPKKTKPTSPSGGSSGSGGGGGFTVSTGGGGTPQYETLPESNAGEVEEGVKIFSLPALEGVSATFSDVSGDAWYKEAVEKLAGGKIISGYENGMFMPQNNITRAEFTKIIVSAFSISASNNKTFSDVAADAWYKEYIDAACGAGIISGYGDTFAPQNYITREDAAVILGRVSSLFSVSYEGYKEFNDMNDVSTYALTTVGAFYENSVVNGSADGNFKPKSNISRAEAAQLILNFVESVSEKYKGVSE